MMKRVMAVLLSTILLLSLSACTDTKKGSNDVAEQSQKQASQQARTDTQGSTAGSGKKDVLILYFSANNTKDVDAVSAATPVKDGISSVEWIADIIHDKVGGDLVPIIPSADYPLAYDDLADYAKDEADNEKRPGYEDLGVDPASYKTVFIGYPIWWYTVPKILETFFESYDLKGVTIVPFNTHAGSGDGGTYDLIREREPDTTVLDGLAVRGDSVGEDSTRKEVEVWLESLNQDK